MTDDTKEADNLAKNLNETNIARQHITEEMVSESLKQIEAMDPNSRIFIVIGKGWSQGVVGLVASKIMQQFHRPAIVATEHMGKIMGSGRSIKEFDIIAALRELGDSYFQNYGGHPAACGFTLAPNVTFEEFKQALVSLVSEKLAPETLLPKLDIDLKIGLHDVNWELFEELLRLEPFGKDNTQPNFVIRGVTVSEISTVGLEGKHLRLKLRSEIGGSITYISCIGFGLGEWCQRLAQSDTCDIVANLDVNEWNGNRELQLKLIDLKKI